MNNKQTNKQINKYLFIYLLNLYYKAKRITT